jgi:hypothetical protein
MEPATVEWPLVLPNIEHLGLHLLSSFSNVIQLYRDLIVKLVQDPTSAQLPESWLPAYSRNWDILYLGAHVLQADCDIAQRLLVASAEALAPSSQPAQRVLDDYRETLIEPLMPPRSWEGKTKSSSVLTGVSDSSKSSGMKSPMLDLLNRLKRATSKPGSKTVLAAYMKVKPANISQWLHGHQKPSGETTLRLLQWVEQQEAQQKQSPGSATTPPGPTTQSKKANEKQSKSGLSKT